MKQKQTSGSWFALYAIEAIAILSVLQSTDDPASAVRAIV
jgi:hypothetical protein